MKYFLRSLIIAFVFLPFVLTGQPKSYLLTAERLFDGFRFYDNYGIVVQGDKIVQVGPSDRLEVPTGAEIIDLGASVLMPGMIEGHAHLLLHPYNETSWNDQVLKESVAERSIRAANHAYASLMAGFTTVRDLGSEGAGYADVGIRESISKDVIIGPRLMVAGPAIVVTGSYGPKGFKEEVNVPLGAHEADGQDDLIKEVRRQIGGGADFIKVYADYRWGPEGEARPTFTLDELKLIVQIAASSGRQVVAHAATEEGMRRATMAGVRTIEHGDAGTKKIFDMMKESNVALCPTLAAGDAIMQYNGWKKGLEAEPERIRKKRASFTAALASGVTIVAGGDVGVFTHGDNVRELEMMEEYGMDKMAVLQSITSGNAKVFGLGLRLGSIQKGLLADIIAVDGNPMTDISILRKVSFVMKGGKIYKQ